MLLHAELCRCTCDVCVAVLCVTSYISCTGGYNSLLASHGSGRLKAACQLYGTFASPARHFTMTSHHLRRHDKMEAGMRSAVC